MKCRVRSVTGEGACGVGRAVCKGEGEVLLPGELANGRIRVDAQLYSIRSWQVPRLGRIGKRQQGKPCKPAVPATVPGELPRMATPVRVPESGGATICSHFRARGAGGRSEARATIRKPGDLPASITLRLR